MLLGANRLSDHFRVGLGSEILLDLGDFFLVNFGFFRVLSAEFSVDVDGFPPMPLFEKQLGHSFCQNWWG